MKNNKSISFKKNYLATAIAYVYVSLAVAPVYASDTEIYVDSTQSSAVSPNLMMVFDTSGSMKWCVDSTKEYWNNGSPVNCPTDSKIRYKVLAEAMKQVLRGDTATGISAIPGYVKMGLARYHPTAPSTKGGYVLYPTRPLDAFVAINPNGSVSNTIAAANGDATQQFTETSSGTTTSGAIKIGKEASNDFVAGLQFVNVRVPRYATVSEAYIQLTADATKSGGTVWELSAEASGNAASYSTSQINTRAYGDIANYSPQDWSSNDVQLIPVTAAINQVVNRADWCGGNALSVRIRDVGGAKSFRSAYSFDSTTDTTKHPKLIIKYLVDPELTNSCIKNSGVTKTTVSTVSNSQNDAYWAADGSGSTNNTTTTLGVNTISSGIKRESGILFNNLQIPQNAVASTATLRVYASNTISSGVQAVTIKGFSSPDVSFCPAGTCSNPTTLKNLPLTTNSTSWNPGSVTKDQFYDIDVTSIVNDVLSPAAGWNVGKNIGFKLWSSTTIHKNTAIYSFDGPATFRPKLTINWSVNELNQLTFLETVRDQIEQEVNNLTVGGATPLASTFAAASRYMYGMEPYYKNSTDYDPRVVENGGTSAVRYVSPIPADDECSANYVFLLTDGVPNDEAGVKSDVKNLMASSTNVCSGSDEAANWSCMNKLAQYNNKTSKLDNTTPKKRIYTSTMILSPLGTTAETNMKTVSETYGGGKAYTATDTAALAKAFIDVANDAIKSSGTISAAGVAVNQLNRLNHLDQLYYAVFDPKPNSLHWQGNLKRYRLGTDGVIYDNSTPAKNAVNSDTGFFKSDAKSFWSTEVDGENASAGGAASKLTATKLPTRKMYTYTDALTSLSSPVSLQEIDFTNLGSTTTLNTTLQGKTGTSGTEYINLMKWYQGYDISSLTSTDTPTEARQRLGGALHSRPILVNYGYTGELATANNADNQDNYLFFSTLEGSLHVVNAKTGEEKFTFTPGEKLATLKDLYLNPAAALPAFGMDLTWVSYRKDTDGSGQIGTGDKVWLYGGMRMGGDNYYALDVTNLDSPKLMFAIDGGKTGTKYARMGQTWSEPVITSIYVEGKPKRVMIFGGGYDDKHENHALALPFADIDKGNQIYIVDAEKGDLLWMASGNSTDSPDKLVDDMKFSIPSSPKAVDLDSDGVADVIYIGDLGGQVFRIDLDRKATTKTNIAKRVRLIAKVGQTETANLVSQRRFYEPPAVATFKNTSGSLFAAVSMGSGYRSRPLNTVTDERFYTFFDYDVTKPNLLSLEDSALQAVITHADLDLLDMNAATTQQNGVGQTKKGWYVDFPESGEKALASGFIFKEKLVFSSYSPTTSSTTNCTPVKGKTNLYTMCMPYGKMCWAAGSEPTGFNNYKKSNIMAGLGGEPQLILTKNPSTGANELNVLVGTSVDKGIFAGTTAGGAQLVPTKKWREKTKK